MSSARAPQWAEAPVSSLRLDVYKDGSLVDRIPADQRPWHVLGRDSAQADIVLAHASLSRAHAGIAQDETGQPFVRCRRCLFHPAASSPCTCAAHACAQLVDLGAANGTTLNGRTLEQSERVPLQNGDTLVFGASSRTYIVRLRKVAPRAPQVERYPEPAPRVAGAPAPRKAHTEPEKETAPSSEASGTAAELASLMPEVAAGFGLSAAQHAAAAAFDQPRKPGASEGGGIRIGASVAKASLQRGSAMPPPPAKPATAQPAEHGLDSMPPPSKASADSTPLPASAAGAGEGGEQDATGDGEEAAVEVCPHGYEFTLKGQEEGKRSVTALAFDPSNGRVAAGSTDSTCVMYDFGGLTSAGQPFRSWTPWEGHMVKRVAWSSSGAYLAVVAGEKRVKVFDREGVEQLMCVQGYLNIRDVVRTKGHIAEVTDVAWHPSDDDWFATSALDGSVRLWDATGKKTLGDLVAAHTLRVQNARGLLAEVTAVAWCEGQLPGGKAGGTTLIAGTSEGALHLWKSAQYYTRPDLSIPAAHGPGEISAIVPCNGAGIGARGRWFATRSVGDGSIKVWDMRKLKRGPIWSVSGVVGLLPMCNMAWAPDGAHLVAGTSVVRGKGNGQLLVWDVATASRQAAKAARAAAKAARAAAAAGDEGEGDEGAPDAVASSGSDVPAPVWASRLGRDGLVQVHTVCEGNSAVVVAWGHEVNQVAIGCGDGFTRVLYHPQVSEKGVLLAVGKRPKRRDIGLPDFMRPVVHNPHALKAFQQQGGRKRALPAKPSTGGAPGKGRDGVIDSANTFTQHFMQKQLRVNLAQQNPQHELTKLAHVAKKGRFVEYAYAGKVKQLADETLEAELDTMAPSALDLEEQSKQ